MDLFSLEGKTALITGGATGIGRMAAEAMVRAGARVLIASRKGDACVAVAEELNAMDAPGSAEGFAADIGTVEGIDALVEEIKARTPALHILMNNSGVTWGAPLGQFPHKAWEKVMSVNVAGVFDLTQKLLPLLIASSDADDPARVINVGSVMGEIPMGDGAYSYAASKAAVIHMSKILAKELAHQHVTVNALAPGPFVSRMTAFATGDEEKREKVGNDVPLGRVGRDDDIAGCVLFLAGRGGSYVTGAVIPVSGGINVMSGHNLFQSALD
ncbi:MAG: SDR family oxidoreductase [Pseudophaeobacter sp. bin_em_oilr2.035]|uniref:SDR family oxidoreductase n=2 Tax=Alphaproteobacteria TaxID=28211 RepID=A0ABD4X6L4_9RHOB|nr:SDR family NAD(P)-dependent oxidoreductase [Phaeobacter gallaeciensis]MDF1771441.1 SDR family oxidoreductase [Pseudophaeobacter sp. bin_em_oilr2.035]MDE4143629.1 SDR family oxidoreductase [Phaeobacter gallaeciensis]MDE4156009.1 SDR family oxidoreductase [Phaeobacter gallaeciensis]MDE4160197.1 SDR family oxidoreductase [Phaeobacter gallaeciensis]MDE4164709.1 SDR family oxidoreductase [Phaeobacter gallaeciensis]